MQPVRTPFELCRGNTYPAVFLPYARAAWTPQTGEGGWPYQYAAGSIRGFRMTHRPSAWTVDRGSFAIMPVAGSLKVLPAERAAAAVNRVRAPLDRRVSPSGPGHESLEEPERTW